MIIINYLFIFAFAMIGEILRARYFQMSKIIRRPKMATATPDAAQATPKVAAEAAAAKVEEAAPTDIYESAKSEKVKALLYANRTLEEKKAEMEKTTTDCEKFNN